MMGAEVFEGAAGPGQGEAEAFLGAGAVGGYSVHSSKAMAMSAPRAIWTSMECSGVKKWLLPSRCERKRTPSSLTFRSWLREKTWNPPESVSRARGQLMNLCSPPMRRMASWPGRR